MFDFLRNHNDAPATEASVSGQNETTNTKIISEARLAANRANAKKSTGPRTALGKAKSASNALKHGLYSPKCFDNFLSDADTAVSLMQNILAEYDPVTPTENILVQQLIHLQLRFLFMQRVFNHAMATDSNTLLESPQPFLGPCLRDLDRLPLRITRLIKEIRAEQSRRDEFTQIELIEDLPPLPLHRRDKVDAEPPNEPNPVPTHHNLRGVYDNFATHLGRHHPVQSLDALVSDRTEQTQALPPESSANESSESNPSASIRYHKEQ